MKLNEHPNPNSEQETGKKPTPFPSQQEYLMFINRLSVSLERKDRKKMSCNCTKTLAFRLYRKSVALLSLLLKSGKITKNMNTFFKKNVNSVTFI